MKILVLGANGQLGKELYQHLACLGEVKGCDRNEVDLTNFESIRTVIRTYQPDWIVNAAAYTAVDKAESEPDLAFTVNAEAVGVIAQEAKRLHAGLIHYSTDYVFDGNKSTPYTENDIPNPINIYGQSKLEGENSIQSSGCNYIIFRTTWIIGAFGNNFAKTVLNLAKKKDSLNIIDDQHGVPTSPQLIARVTESVIHSSNSSPWAQGIYNLTPQGQTTWHSIAEVLLSLAQTVNPGLISENFLLNPITATEYPTPAKRPKNSQLDTTKLQQQLDFNLPHWKKDFSLVAAKIMKEL